MQLLIWEVKDLQSEYKEGGGDTMRLLKQDVINKLAEKTGLYKKDVRAVLDSFYELVYEELDADNSILITNLFKVEPITVDSRKRYSPYVDDNYYIEKEHKTVKITPAS